MSRPENAASPAGGPPIRPDAVVGPDRVLASVGSALAGTVWPMPSTGLQESATPGREIDLAVNLLVDPLDLRLPLLGDCGFGGCGHARPSPAFLSR